MADMDAQRKERIRKFISTVEYFPYGDDSLADLLLRFENYLGECEDRRMRD